MAKDLRDLPVFRDLFKEEREQALAEGREEGLERMRRLLIRLVQKRFPQLDALANKQVSTIPSQAILEEMISKLMFARTAKEARSYLTNWKQANQDDNDKL